MPTTNNLHTTSGGCFLLAKSGISGGSSVRNSRFTVTANHKGNITSVAKASKTDGKKFITGFSNTPAAQEKGTDLYIEVKSSITN